MPKKEDAAVLSEIKKRIHLPLICDIHFDYKMALAALEHPIDKIRINPGNIGGYDRYRQVIRKAKEKNYGYDADRGEYTDLRKAGIVDPVKVTRSALQNGASVACLLLTTETLVADVPEKKGKAEMHHDEHAGMGGMGEMDMPIPPNSLPMRGGPVDSSALGRHEGTAEFGNIATIDESPVVAGLLATGSDDGVVAVSRDGGQTWARTERFPAVPETTYVSRVVFSRFAPGTLYATMDGHRSNDFRPYVLKSTDYGRTWQPIFDDQPTGSIGANALRVVEAFPGEPEEGLRSALKSPLPLQGKGIGKTCGEVRPVFQGRKRIGIPPGFVHLDDCLCLSRHRSRYKER